MSRISPTSSLKSQRIHSSFINRNRRLSNSSNSVEPVNPVNPVMNSTAFSSANHLISSDHYYEKLENLKKEYLNFYHQERNLHKAVNAIEKNADINISYIKNLVDKYNKTAVALYHFDKEINTNHSQGIKTILKEYEFDLNNMGIYITEDNNKLEINEEVFKENLLTSKDNFNGAFKPINTMILKLYKRFKNIRGPIVEDSDHKYDQFPNIDYAGIIMDKNS